MNNKYGARLAVGLLALVAAAGCNPILLLGHLINNDENKLKAEFPLKPPPGREKAEVRVVILTSCPPSASPEMAGIDRLLAAELIPMLEKRCLENKEKLVVLKSKPIDDFKRDNPTWRSMLAADIGKKFNADYVIDIEVLGFAMFEPNSHHQLLRGKAHVAVQAFDLSKRSPDPAWTTELNEVYPKTAEVQVTDVPPSTFRQQFVKHLAAKMVIKFTAHSTIDRLD